MGRRPWIPALAALAAGCADAPAENSGMIVAPAAIETPPIIAVRTAPAVAATPTATPSAVRPVTVDPPLPPELADDSKLKPLPPRPPVPALDKGSRN